MSWVKTYRSLVDWEWFKSDNMVRLFLYLILSANYTEKKYMGVTIGVGELVTSLKDLNEATGISLRSLRTCINRLKSTHEVTTKTTNKFTIITICNYEFYQSGIIENDMQNDKQSDKQTTNKRQTNDTLLYKEERKNKKKGITNVIPKEEKVSGQEILDLFNSTCKSFPKVKSLTKSRSEKIRLRLSEMNSMETLKSVFNGMEASDFLKGLNDSGWRASFDWVFENDKNWVKVFEGNYQKSITKSTIGF